MRQPTIFEPPLLWFNGDSRCAVLKDHLAQTTHRHSEPQPPPKEGQKRLLPFDKVQAHLQTAGVPGSTLKRNRIKEIAEIGNFRDSIILVDYDFFRGSLQYSQGICTVDFSVMVYIGSKLGNIAQYDFPGGV